MNTPEHLKYADSHEWVEVTDNVATVGITDHAQNELSDVVFVELPEIGASVSVGDSVAVVESVKAASDIYAPVAGEVTEVNTALTDDPSLVNSAPYADGWLFKLSMSNPADLDSLKDSAAYQAHLQ